MKTENKRGATKPYSVDLKEYLQKITVKQIPIKDKGFLQRILKFRRKWKIPIRGFKNKKSVQKWLQNPPDEILKYPKTVEQTEKETIFVRAGEKIIKLTMPEVIEGIKTARNITNFPFGSFFTDLQAFTTENNIDYTLAEPLLSYIYYGKILESSYPKTIVEISERETNTKSRTKIEDRVCVSFGPNTRQKDVLYVWDKFIAPLQEKLTGHLGKKLRNR